MRKFAKQILFKKMKTYTETDRLRSYSMAFSRSVFSNLLLYDDFSRLDVLIRMYDSSNCKVITYWDYIRYMYRAIRKSYRCEYVYKNEFLTRLLIKKYGTKETIAINEFKVSRSIADIALFNGESKVFEIKTEYDTQKRLKSQIGNYEQLFDKCYVIIPESALSQYLKVISCNIGIIVLRTEKNSVALEEYREALYNDFINVDILMRSLRTQEYKNIVLSYYGALPKVSCFQMFDECASLLKAIPVRLLKKLFIQEIKHRSSITSSLNKIPYELRQIGLSMNLDMNSITTLRENLDRPILKA